VLVGDAVTEEGSAVDRYEDGLIAGPGPPNPVEEKMREADLEAEVEEVEGFTIEGNVSRLLPSV
jgi:hypothetical protein